MNQKLPKPMLDTLAPGATPAEHPSADVLAAFMERALVEGEKQLVTDHLARCAECRELVFLASDAIEPAATDKRSVAAKPRWQWTLGWVWVIPVAAMFLVGAGLLVRQSYFAAPTEKERASAKVQEKGSGSPAQSPEVIPAQPAPATAVPSPVAKAQPRTAPATAALSQRSQPLSGNVNAMNTSAPAVSETEHAKLTPPKPLPRAPLMAIGGAMAGAAPAAPPPRNSFAPTTGETDLQFPGNSLSLSVNRDLVGAVRTAHPGWQVTKQGHLEHLTSDGWSRVLAEQTSAFRVVSVTGNDVWAGGNNGMLVHSGDGGVHWNKVSVTSAGGGETPTIVSIGFDDAQHGVVIADTGARYSTADGGATWAKQ
ncbi:MAG: YCF48-related protein [Candidatus Korobacteraceae bacterium]